MFSCVSCLLAHQPNVNLYDKAGFALTHYLSASWQYDTLDLLLGAGAHVNCRCNSFDMTALHLAAAAAPIKRAVGAGARISHKVVRVSSDSGGASPVEHINRPYGVATLRTLLKYGAKPNARDSQGRTALQILAENMSEERWPAEELVDAVALLVSFGARFDDSSASVMNLKNKLNMHGSVEAVVEKWGSLPVISGDNLGLGINCFIAIDLSEDEVDPIPPGEELLDKHRYWSEPADRCNLCGIHFTLFRRQHHCRLCNALCCDECSRKRTVIDGNQVRTCDCCFNRAMSKLDAKNKEEMLSRLIVVPTSSATAGADKIKLFGNAVVEAEQTSSTVKKPSAAMSKTMNAMGETHNKLLERGEKLSKAAIKSEELSNQANDFAMLAKQLADQQKASRWF